MTKSDRRAAHGRPRIAEFPDWKIRFGRKPRSDEQRNVASIVAGPRTPVGSDVVVPCCSANLAWVGEAITSALHHVWSEVTIHTHRPPAARDQQVTTTWTEGIVSMRVPRALTRLLTEAPVSPDPATVYGRSGGAEHTLAVP